jgi:hypothetical protein
MSKPHFYRATITAAALVVISATIATAGFPAPPGVNVNVNGYLPAPPAVNIQVNGYLPAPPGVHVYLDAGRPYYMERDRRVYVERDRRHGRHGRRHGHDHRDREYRGESDGHGRQQKRG